MIDYYNTLLCISDNKCSLITQWMILMSRLFLVDQKHSAQTVLSVFWWIPFRSWFFLVNQIYITNSDANTYSLQLTKHKTNKAV